MLTSIRARALTLAQARDTVVTLPRRATARAQYVVRRAVLFAQSIAASKWVQSLVIGTVLFTVVGTLLYVPAVIGYFTLYYKYLPQLETTVPVHLQYGVGPNPFGIASLEGVVNRQPYDISVSLALPRSPANLERGNFMLALHLLSPGPTAGLVPSTKLKLKPTIPYLPPAKPIYDRAPFASWHTLDSLLQPTRLDLPAFLASHTIVHTSTRPALMPYIDPLASLASRVFFLAYHVLSPHAASTTHLTIPMAEDLSFTIPRRDEGRRLLPESLLLEVQGGQGIQVYDVRVTLSARLSGLRGFMYRWRITAFVLFTAAFWIGGVGVLGGAVLLVGINLKEVKDYDFEEDSEAEDEDDTVRTDDDKLLGRKRRGPKRWRSDSSPSSDTDRGGGGLGRRLNIKKEEDTEDESTPILPSVPLVETSTEADDEAEMEGPERRRSKGKLVKREESVDSKDEGVATSSSAQAGSEGARKRTVATLEASEEG